MKRNIFFILAVISIIVTFAIGCFGPTAQPITSIPPQTTIPTRTSPVATATATVTPPPSSTTATATTPTGTTPTVAQTPTTTVETHSGTLNLYGTDPLTLDPALVGDAGSHDFAVQLFSGLLRLDDSLLPVSDIAKDWTVSADGKTYTFNLRPNVVFQNNGRAVTASDFKFSWERACLPATGSQTAGTYLGDIVGVKDMLAGKANSLSGVVVKDNFTLQVTIDKPKAYFLAKMTYPTAYVVDKDQVSKTNWWMQPNGTGPFRLKSWTASTSLILSRNEFYYGEKAHVDTVNYGLYSGNPMDLYETGKIDIVGTGGSYLYKVTDPAGQYHKQLNVTPSLSISYVGFNTRIAPFDDVNIRRAFSMAVNKELIASLSYNNSVPVAYGILPPGMPGYNAGLNGLKFDVNAAKQAIAASKYGDVSKLPPIVLTTNGSGGGVGGDIDTLVDQWKKNLGVTVTVRQVENERFFYHVQEELDNMYIMGWVADYPHPQDFLDILFSTGSENNYGGYSNTGVDSLLEQAASESDTAKSYKIYQQIEQMLVDEAACLPLWFGQDYTLIKPYISNYQPSPQGSVILNRVQINPH